MDELRVNGSVIPLQDLIKDAGDKVVHFSNYKAQQLVETEIAQGDALKPVVCCKSLQHDFESLADKLSGSGRVTGIPSQLSCLSQSRAHIVSAAAPASPPFISLRRSPDTSA